ALPSTCRPGRSSARSRNTSRCSRARRRSKASHSTRLRARSYNSPIFRSSWSTSRVMLGIHDYWLFVASGILLNLVPGQDTLYILGSSIGQGRRIGVASALGISAGCVAHTCLAALGLSAILATSAAAFLVVKLAGAAYLIYLGVSALMTRSGTISPLP